VGCVVLGFVPDKTTIRLRKVQGGRITAARGDRPRRVIATALAAEGFPVTEQALAWWEAGERSPSAGVQVALAKVLGVPWSDLFSLDHEVA
jgi:transcriptional regulator with XRE-family HTH domain